MREVRRTFSMRDSIKASGNGLAKSFDGVGSTLQCIRGKFAQHRFQLGEELLDGVEVGTVCGKVDENGAAPLNRLVHPSDLVNGDIVHEYDVTAFESWCENLFDVGPERLAIHRTFEHERCGHTLLAKSRNKRSGLPIPVQHLLHQTLATGRAAVDAGHIARNTGFIDKNQPLWIKPRLPPAQRVTLRDHVGPILFGGVQAFF